MISINLPKITATNPEGQIQQMHSYLYQVVEQLNWALSNVDTNNYSNNAPSNAVEITQDEALTPQEAENTFNSIKALIIKSADIVKAYEETIKENFSGEYVAVSDFGTYTENTNAQIEENSKGLTAVYTNVQAIGDDIRETNAYIQRGFLGYDEDTGEAAYGLGVGETDNQGVFKQYAWFTANKLTFFDSNRRPVAYISNSKLFIKDAEFIGTVKFGKYLVDTSNGLAFTWHE